MNNLINAFTNFPFIFAAKAADPITRKFIFAAGVSSAIYHLFENHKHNIHGITTVSRQTSYYLNRLDVLSANMLIIRMLHVYYTRYGFTGEYFTNHPWFSMFLLGSFSCNLISEYYPPIANKPALYTIVHSTWHLSVFMLVWHFVITK